MKAHKSFFLAITLVFFLSACSGNKQADENTKAVKSLQRADKNMGIGDAMPAVASAMKMQVLTYSPLQWNRESLQKLQR